MASKYCVACGSSAKRKCSKCKLVYYCSEKCHLEDWKSHKVDCTDEIILINSIYPKNTLFTIRYTKDGRGLGAFAKYLIPAYTLICDVPFDEKTTIDVTIEEIEQNNKFSSMPKEQFLSLTHEKDLESFEAKMISVMTYNGFNFRTKELCLRLYLLAARFNHDCMPTGHMSFNPENEHVKVFTLKEIQPHEEITVSYTGTAMMSYETRQQKLLDAWGFKCKCLLCNQGEKSVTNNWIDNIVGTIAICNASNQGSTIRTEIITDFRFFVEAMLINAKIPYEYSVFHVHVDIYILNLYSMKGSPKPLAKPIVERLIKWFRLTCGEGHSSILETINLFRKCQ